MKCYSAVSLILAVCLVVSACDKVSVKKRGDNSTSPKRPHIGEGIADRSQSMERRVEHPDNSEAELKSLRDLPADKFNERLNDFGKIKIWLSKIPADKIEIRLDSAGFEKDTEQRSRLINLYCLAKSELDPQKFASWLKVQKTSEINSKISYLARFEPEMAVDIVSAANMDEGLKATCYAQVFEVVSAVNPERSVQLLESVRFNDPKVENRAMIAVIVGFDREVTTPERLARIMSGFSTANLDSFPEAVEQAGGVVVEYPVATVLEQFPLDRKPWERVVAISFLETKAYRGATGDGDISAFLQSNKASLLTDVERGRLHKILGK